MEAASPARRRHRGRTARAAGAVREPPHHGSPAGGPRRAGEYDAATDLLTMLVSTQQPHQLRTVVAEVCGMTEASVRVIAPDMGGGFGNKQHFLREECLVAMLARITGVPVQWAEDRTEALTAVVHSRRRCTTSPLRTTTTAPARAVGRRDQRRRQPRPLLLGHRAVAGDGRRTVRRLRGAGARLDAVVRRDHDVSGGRVPRLRPTAGAPHHRAGDGPHRPGRSRSIRSKCGGGTSSPTTRRGRSPRTAARASTSGCWVRSSSSCSTSSGTTRGGSVSRRRAPTDGTSGSASRCSCRAARRRSTAWPVASGRGRWRRCRCCPTAA